MALDPHQILQEGTPLPEPIGAPLAGSRQQRLQRLQIGLLGLGAILLLVGLANFITRATNEPAAVASELPPVTASDVPPPSQRDPLADAGVAPDLVDGDAALGDSAGQTADGAQLPPIN